MRILAIFLFILLIPILIFISLIIIIFDKSPILFKQVRIGRNLEPFVIYKFRTMENQQITKTGKYLRKTGIDELPQLINIIKGDMDIVGPRPLTESDIKRLEWNAPEYIKRWSVKPGITGLSQLSQICSADNTMKLDLEYVAKKSFVIDLQILIKSVLIPITGKKNKIEV